MKYIKHLLLILAISSLMAGCDMSDFGDINVNPNAASNAYTTMLFGAACRYVPRFIMDGNQFDPWQQSWTGYIAETKNNQYGALNSTLTFATGDYYLYPIKNLNKIISMNEDEATKNSTVVTSFGSNANQIAASKTLRAFFYMTLTDILGPIPYSESFQGDSLNNWTPKFDSQEDIYKALDVDLQAAYKQFDTTSSLSNYDFIYQGDMRKWKKFNATLRMMLAIKLTDIDPTNGKTRFAQAYADGAMTTNDDSFNWTFDENNMAPFYYIGNTNYSARALGESANEVIVNYLKDYKDNRLFKYFDLNGYLGTHHPEVSQDTLRYGKSTTMDALINSIYFGVPFGLNTANDVITAAQKAVSVAQTRYCEAEGTYNVISATRCLLVEAEAAELGWISADPETLYETGIKASFEFTGAEDVDDYLATDKVKLSSDKDTALKQIVTQRFLAGFLTDGVEAWSDWRRYNIPTLSMGPLMITNGYSVYPYRLQYDTDDTSYNTENANEAISTYLGGKDDRWSRVWWDTKDNE